MTTTTELILPNPWNGCTNNKIINTMSLTEEQHNRLNKVAERELRETESIKRQSLDSLREWIQKNSDIENCLTDDKFLLKFLRVKKYSVPMAQQMLLKYLNFRKKFSHIMCNLDYTDSKLSQLMSRGFVYVSPFRDSNGRRVIIYDLKKLDLQIFDGTDLGRAMATTYETLMDDEDNQIFGVNHVADVAAVGAQHLSLFSITEFSYLIRWGEQSFPMRHKEVNMINFPTPLKYVYDFAKTNMSQKLRDRFSIHDSIEALHRRVDKKCLPAELGGEMPAKEMIEMWKEEVNAKTKRLLSYDQMDLLSDKGIVTRKNRPAQDDSGSLPGSFRKLELD